MKRREFLIAVLGAAATALHSARAQEEGRNTVSGPMNQGAYRSVKLPPKPSAGASMSEAQRNELEHHIQCQCGCTLDVFTCRTTDFSCSVSPAMHVDVMGLVAGGYTGAEILDAFRRVYGERVLMAPVREGFNWLGYLLPFGALAGGGAVVFTLLRRWSHPELAATPALPVDASPEELERLQRALRSDE